jgi:hypothetical protein
VYVGELLRLHPDLHAFPNDLWELPYLAMTGDFLALQRALVARYPENGKRLGAHDLLPLHGAALLAYLHVFAAAGRRVLLKMPSVEFLHYFDLMFPHEHLLVLVRDGRDVVSSTLRTWPEQDFDEACIRWDRAARMILFCERRYAGRAGYLRVLYEDAQRDPAALVRAVCGAFGLDPARYPFDQASQLPLRGSSEVREGGAVTWAPIAKPAGFSPLGRWATWSPEQKASFKRLAGQSLIDLGYATDLSW